MCTNGGSLRNGGYKCRFMIVEEDRSISMNLWLRKDQLRFVDRAAEREATDVQEWVEFACALLTPLKRGLNGVGAI